MQDSSGVKVYYTNTLRANHGGSLELGDHSVKFPQLPDGNSAVHRQSNCPSVATQFSLGTDTKNYQQLVFKKQLTSSLNVFGSFLHMHRSIFFVLLRKLFFILTYTLLFEQSWEKNHDKSIRCEWKLFKNY